MVTVHEALNTWWSTTEDLPERIISDKFIIGTCSVGCCLAILMVNIHTMVNYTTYFVGFIEMRNTSDQTTAMFHDYVVKQLPT